MRKLSGILLLLGLACAHRGPLAGTSWQLVKFEGGDGTVLTPDDRAKYTIAFETDSTVSVRVDCNRGRGTWPRHRPPGSSWGPWR